MSVPGVDGRVPCCGRQPETLPRGDWMTAGNEYVTCTGAEVTS